MTIMELATAVQEKRNINICIINNGPPITIKSADDTFDNRWSFTNCDAFDGSGTRITTITCSYFASVQWVANNYTIGTGQSLTLTVTGNYQVTAKTQFCNTAARYTILDSNDQPISGGNDACVDVSP